MLAAEVEPTQILPARNQYCNKMATTEGNS
jgi:hypothetical protein